MTSAETEEEKYMYRCIQLAKNGSNNVSPNPIVGAVIVHNDIIIGEGYHRQYGGPHAEVNAINSVKDPSFLSDSTIYVSLEPCSHYGKTPPCVELIIKKHIPRVIIGCKDPFPKVAGQGIEKLEKAGIEVKTGVLEKECKELIKRFITFNTLHRPYIILKWAESADGYIDIKRTGGKPVFLSTPLTTMLVHKKRAEADAIMIGTHTALLDNPSLTVRAWKGNHPIRIVIDKNSILPPHLHLYDGSVPTFVFTDKNNLFPKENHAIKYIPINFNDAVLPQIIKILYQEGIQTLLVEGGTILLQSFIDNSLWDETYVEKTKKQLHNGIKAPIIKGYKNMDIENRFGSVILHYISLVAL